MGLNRSIKYLCWIFLLISGGTVSGQTTFVWPGDVSTNGTVNHIDLLFLGLRYGDTGPGRDSVSINWTGHEVQKWLPPLAGRPDPAHADCNGDSLIDLQDVVAIETNYGLDNSSNLQDSSSLSTNSSHPLLEVEGPQGVLVGGQRDTLPILLGSAAMPIDSLYGFALRLNLDSTLIDTAYLWLGDSWLGNPATDLISVERYRPGEFEFSATRIDQMDVLNGQGVAGGVVVVMIDNLKQAVSFDSIRPEIDQALCLKASGKVVDVRTKTESLPVAYPTTDPEVLVFPNPARETVQIKWLTEPSGPITGWLRDATGRAIHQFQWTGRTTRVSLNGFLPGMYLLELREGDSRFTQHLIIMN